MTGAAGIVAGVDIGNTTTEIVIAAHDGDRWAVVAFHRRPTIGPKGALITAALGLALLAGRPPNSDLDAAPAPSAHDCTSDHVY